MVQGRFQLAAHQKGRFRRAAFTLGSRRVFSCWLQNPSVAGDAVVRKDPDVRMRHIFADDFAQDKISIERFLLRERDLPGHFKIFSDIRHVPDPAAVLLWNDESVAGGLG